MNNEARITQLAQSIYLAKNNRYNDVDGDELTQFLDITIDWVNQYIEELEMEADWNYVRQNSYLLGTAYSANTTSFALPDEINRLVFSPYRDLTIRQDGSTVATFKMVRPSQIANPSDPETGDRATVIGRNVILSRPLNENEIGGTVHADVVEFIPRLTRQDVRMLDIVTPKQLIVLGVAKNATLPDIVQGGISPSLTQKYADLLRKAVAENDLTSEADSASSEDFSFVRGVW